MYDRFISWHAISDRPNQYGFRGAHCKALIPVRNVGETSARDEEIAQLKLSVVHWDQKSRECTEKANEFRRLLQAKEVLVA